MFAGAIGAVAGLVSGGYSGFDAGGVGGLIIFGVVGAVLGGAAGALGIVLAAIALQGALFVGAIVLVIWVLIHLWGVGK